METVGPPFKGNEVKIAEDGEILVKGENVMLGYWNKKEETEKKNKDSDYYDEGQKDILESEFQIFKKNQNIKTCRSCFFIERNN